MTGSYMLKMCEDAAAWLSEIGPTRDVRVVPERSMYSGNTVDARDGGAHSVRVGSAELKSRMDEDIRIGDALVPFVGLFHEVAGHVMQLEHEFQHPSRLGNALFLSHCSCKCSERYHGQDSNGFMHPAYFGHPHEIAAQYMGIKCATAYLRHAVGTEKANAWMSDYVRYRAENKCEFLPGVPIVDEADEALRSESDAEARERCVREADQIMSKYQTVESVLDGMDSYFQDMLRKPRIFEPDRSEFDALQLFSMKRPNFDSYGAVMHCRNGIRQDAMMAVAYFDTMEKFDPDGFNCMTSRAAFKDIDMDIVKIFTGFGDPIRPKPKGRYTALERLKAITDDEDRLGAAPKYLDAPEF